MNGKKLSELIGFYKRNYLALRAREDYKWQAAEEWLAAAPLRAENFTEGLEKALSGTGKLLDSGRYFPKTALLMLMKKDAEAVELMFRDLFRDSEPLRSRVEVFRMKAAMLRKKYYAADELPDDDQDEHAISVYLSLSDPGSHFIYRFTAFQKAAQLLEHRYLPKRNDPRNLTEYYAFCEEILAAVLADDELVRLEAERRTAYPAADPAYHLLTSDIVFCAAGYYAHPELLEEKTLPERPGRFRLKARTAPLSLEAVPFYDAAGMELYEKRLHDAGLRFILHEEKLRVRRYEISLKKQPEILSPGRARGEGYEILSYDRHGEPLYIAVRVTQGGENDSFGISEAERIKSASVPEQYRLYRVYGFDPETEHGSYSIYKGDLTPMCLNPSDYRVVF